MGGRKGIKFKESDDLTLMSFSPSESRMEDVRLGQSQVAT